MNPTPVLLCPGLYDADESLRDVARFQDSEEVPQGLKIYSINSSPIAYLPPELLSKIFLLYQRSIQGPETDLYEQTCIDHPKPPRDYLMPLEWIKLIHVSKRWREVGKNLKELWSHFSFRYFLLERDLIMARSDGRNLVFRDSIGDESIALCGLFFYEHLHRLREIDVSGYDILSRVLNPHVIPATTLPSNLCCLRLACSVSGLSALADVDLLAAFLSRTPDLKVLEIDFPLKWNAPDLKLAGLTHLKIMHGDHISKPLASEFFQAIASLETLQLLHLVGDALPRRVGDPPVAFSHLERQRTCLADTLRVLILDSGVDSLHFLLDNITVPQKTQIRLRSSRCPERTNIPYLVMIISRLKHICWPFNTLLLDAELSIHTMVMEFSSRQFLNHDGSGSVYAHSLKLQIYADTPITCPKFASDNDPVNMNDSLINIELPWFPYNKPLESVCRDAPAFLSDICHIFQRHMRLSVLTLRVRDDGNISSLFTVGDTYFLDVFGQQPLLQKLYTNPPVLESLLRNLSPPIDEAQVKRKRMAAESPPTSLFPQLCFLHVSNNYRTCISDQAFCASLARRAKFCQALDTLSISSPSNLKGPYSSAALLQKQVSNLILRPH
ncbi:hypothetical protein JR316_0007444 [Psilocybe cubensis]|uniref:F-box domain-containing protein n=2 Tax=Psilocybe cubensis TaxID=181762 RepID=A0A8H7XS86_PSICU|nr:hypothetical protein JR316_0007444 [Psilocybe cubensis]KAH9480842.1 hypothetical protein JR316_0007444 [Psilocybe cubensis]